MNLVVIVLIQGITIGVLALTALLMTSSHIRLKKRVTELEYLTLLMSRQVRGVKGPAPSRPPPPLPSRPFLKA